MFCGVVLGFYSGFSVAIGLLPFSSIKPPFCKSQKNFAVAVSPNYGSNMPTFCIENSTIAANMPQIAASFVQNVQTETENSEKGIFAKARNNCTLYVTSNVQDNSLSNIYFTVPEGYFVQLLDTTSSSAYMVSYNDKVGYISPTSAKRVSFVPKTPTSPILPLTTHAGSGTQLRAFASTSSDMVALVPPTSEVQYIASVFGDKPTNGLSSVWYYVRYFPALQPTIYYEGYVYSERVQTAPEVPKNLEDEPLPTLATSPLPQETAPRVMPAWLKGVVIALLILPAVLFGIYLVVAIRKRKQTEQSL